MRAYLSKGRILPLKKRLNTYAKRARRTRRIAQRIVNRYFAAARLIGGNL